MKKNNKKYNFCQECGKWLGFWSWIKFWQKSKLCESCENEKGGFV